jgi:transcription-repair coupling factor (superfamily II helicase)
VGRGARRAYAYLLHPSATYTDREARQRLETIGEATELGAGFRIAMRDLEIRGAGELLGARQHGHIAAVGFDLYTRLLAKAVQEARQQGLSQAPRGGGEAGVGANDDSPVLDRAAPTVPPLEQAVQISLPLAAHLPETYLADSALRLQLYRRLAGATSEIEVNDLQAEMEDRFGPLPEEGRNLFYQLQIKLLALAAGVKAIGVEEGQIVLRADSLEDMDRAWLQRRLGDRARVARRSVWLPLDGDERWRTILLAVLQAIRAGLGR